MISSVRSCQNGNIVLSNIAMAVLAFFPLLNWYSIPFPISLGAVLTLGVSIVGLLVPGFKVRMFPGLFYVLMFYIFVIWSYRQGMTVWSFLPPGGTTFFIFLISLGGGTALFNLKLLRRYMGIVVFVSVFLFWIQLVAIYTIGKSFCFVPNLTGKFIYEGLTYAEMVVFQKNNSPCSIFLEKSYMAYYLVTYLCLRFFSPDLRELFLKPVNIILVLTLLVLNSGSGILGLAVLIAVKLFDIYYSSGRKRRFVVPVVVLLLMGMIYVYIHSGLGSAMADRSQELHTEGTSGYDRVVSGYVVYGLLPHQEQLIGTTKDRAASFSDQGYINYERFYVNGIQMVLITTGAMGLLLYFMFYASLFRPGDILTRMSIITLLLFSLIESDYLNPYHLILTVIPCAIVYQQNVVNRV